MSTTIDEARKKKISVLKADFMSLEDSEYEDITTPRDGIAVGVNCKIQRPVKRRKD